MNLKSILSALKISSTLDRELLNTNVTNIDANSKKVMPGSIFVAIKGNNVDGHYFISEAFKQGALIVFAEEEIYIKILKDNKEFKQKVILVKDTRAILNKLCSIFYNTLPQNIIAVTGTNGKTSTSCMFSQILNLLNISCAQSGTLGNFFNGKPVNLNSFLTTSTAENLFKFLNKAKQQNIYNAIIEASSHGINQGRIDNIPIKIAAFTNLSQDHLDYHKDMEDYFFVKSKLFLNILKRDGLAIINQDDLYGIKLIDSCKKHNIGVLTYGKNSDNLKLIKLQFQDFGYVITLSYNNHTYEVKLNILGTFQVYNLLCAILIILSLNLANIESILKVVPQIKPVNGRLEYIKRYNEANIILDYAHTPEALELSLQALRDITLGKLYVVFGCGGNRDIGKRKIMGEIASKLSDYSYITDDNPRNEEPHLIRLEIAKGFKNNNKFTIIGNRQIAIIEAIKSLRPGDTLLVAGKGHETTQIVGNTNFFHSDRDIILNFCNN